MNRQRCLAWMLLALLPAPLPSAASGFGHDQTRDIAGARRPLTALSDRVAEVAASIRGTCERLASEIREAREAQTVAERERRSRELEEFYSFWEDECADGYQPVPVRGSVAAAVPTSSYPLDQCLSGHDRVYDVAVYGSERSGEAGWDWLVGRGRQLWAGASEIATQLEPVATVRGSAVAYRDELECRGYPVRKQQLVVRLRGIRVALEEPQWHLASSPKFDSWIEGDCAAYSLVSAEPAYRSAAADVAPAVARSVDSGYGRPLLMSIAQTLGGLSAALQDASNGVARLAD